MAEQTEGVKNKRLLVVSLVLGLFVVLIYNAHVARIRAASKGTDVLLLKARHDLKKGDKITEKNVELVAVSKTLLNEASGFVTLQDRKKFDAYEGNELFEDVKAQEYLTFQRLNKQGVRAANVQPGNTSVTLTVDPNESPGAILEPGGRADILGQFSFGGKPEYYRILEYARISEIGGQADEPGRGSSGAGRAYTKVGVEVSRDVALKLVTLTRGMVVRVLPVHGDVPVSNDPKKAVALGEINPDLEKLAMQNGLLPKSDAASGGGK